jgi:putative redox protein
MATVKTEYLGDLRTEAVHQQSGTTIITDAPLDNQGKGEAFSPSDLVATALGSCMMTIMGIVARRDNIDLQGSTLETNKIMSKELPRKIVRLELTFQMRSGSSLSETDIKKLEKAAHTCPVALSIHPDIEQVIVFNWN